MRVEDTFHFDLTDCRKRERVQLDAGRVAIRSAGA